MCHPEPQAKDLSAFSDLSVFRKRSDPSGQAPQDDGCNVTASGRGALPLPLGEGRGEGISIGVRVFPHPSLSQRERVYASPGFTLVELSIVLVIIGLILGGVMVGRDMMHQANLRTILADFNAYTIAVDQFVTKYQALPGDFPDAQRVWGSSASCGANGSGGPGVLTCNGNGNGQVDSGISGGPVLSDQEVSLVAQHLANSGLVSGTYTGGAWSELTAHYSARSKFRFYYAGNMPWSAKFFAGTRHGNIFEFTDFGSMGGTDVPILTPEEALSIDMKADDGLPGQGKILAPAAHYHSNYSANCTTSTNPATATYNLALATIVAGISYTNDRRCSLFFILDY